LQAPLLLLSNLLLPALLLHAAGVQIVPTITGFLLLMASLLMIAPLLLQATLMLQKSHLLLSSPLLL
jgi:hypothetical protein